MDNVKQIAGEFSRVLRDWLTPEQMESVISRNRREPDKNVCHSHDYCDANEAMIAAFRQAVGREIWMPSDWEDGRCTEEEHDADFQVWNTAWTAALDSEFNLED